MSHISTVTWAVLAKSPLANHGTAGRIKILLISQKSIQAPYRRAVRRGTTAAEYRLGLRSRLGDIVRPLVDHLIDHPPFDRHLAGEEVVALERVLDLLQRLPGMLHVDFVQALLEIQYLLGMQHDVRRLALKSPGRLVQHDP